MKVLDEARSQIDKAIRDKKHELARIESEIYKLEAARKSIEGITELKRIRKVSIESKCEYCGNEFKAKAKGTRFCSPPCSGKARKGIPLIKGDNLTSGH